MNKKNRDKRTRKRKAAVKKLGGNEEERSINEGRIKKYLSDEQNKNEKQYITIWIYAKIC
jgi:hypothetical protein